MPAPSAIVPDLLRDNPVGRVPDADHLVTARLDVGPDGWDLRRGHRRRRGRWAQWRSALSLTDTTHAVQLTGAQMLSPQVHEAAATLIATTAARGSLVFGALGSGFQAYLGEELAAALPARLDDSLRPGDLDWDVAAVRQRRAALRPGLGEPATVSVVLVSKRPHEIHVMLEQMAAQTYPRFELVIGLHGIDDTHLAAHLAELGLDGQILLIGESVVFGDALNLAFERASGRYVTKIDDDDFYGPDHLWDLVLAHAYSGATLVGKATTVVYLEELDTTVRRVFGTQESFTHRVAGGTMLLSREDFAQLGGWDAVPRGVDTALLATVDRAGGTTYFPHDIGYLYVRHARHSAAAHTWNTDLNHFLKNNREQWVGRLRHPEFGTLGGVGQ